MTVVVVSMRLSSSLSVGESYVIVVAIAEIMHMVKVGYPAACIDASYVVSRSRTLLTVL